MKRIISILFVLIMIFSTSVNAIVPHSTVDELGLNEGIFEYYFENSETFEILNKVLISYNERFGYETDREIKIGEGENEITAAIFDEEKIIIYCKYIEESGIKMSLQSKHLRFLLEPFIENKELENNLHNFVNLLSDISPSLNSLILPLIFEYTPTPNKPYSPYSPYMNVLEIISIIIGYLSICYLLYILIYVLYCLIKKKKLQRIKSKVVLSLLALFYLLMNGLNGIINCVFIIINSF